MADTSLPPEQSILASGQKFAREEAKHNTLTVEAQKAEGGAPAEVTTTIATSGSTTWFDWLGGAWVKRKFTRGGTSIGVKGEIKF